MIFRQYIKQCITKNYIHIKILKVITEIYGAELPPPVALKSLRMIYLNFKRDLIQYALLMEKQN